MLKESNKIEFKRELNDKFEKEVVAFLNSNDGGTIYIGLNDDGTPYDDLGDLDKLQLKIVSRIRDNIKPSTIGLFQVTTEYVKNHTVVKVLLSVGMEKPYYIANKGMTPEGCYVRIGTSTQQMPNKLIENLFIKRLHYSLKETVSPRQELTFGVLSGYYIGKGYTLNEHFKTNLELLNSDKNYNYLAYLMADENGESFRVAKYSGDDKLDLIENNEYGYCCLIHALNNILNKFKVENPTKTKITYYKRYEANLVDADALKEIIINAFVHNDYSTGCTPIFEIYNNRFEITSYGGLLPTQSEEDLFSGISMPRNKELVRIFRDLNLVEQLGTGMKKILRHYGRDIYTIKDSYIKVTVPFRDTDRYLDYLISQDQANNNSNPNTTQTNLF